MGLDSIFPGLPPTPGDLVESAGDFFDGVASFFSSSGPSAESIKVGMLVKTVLSGPGAGGLYEAHRATQRQVDVQTELAGHAHELVGRLEAAWSGKSSDGARQLIRSFADVADESSKVLSSNAQNLQRQVDSFERMRGELEPMPDPPPEKGAFNPDFNGAAKKRIRRYQQMAERNRQRYQGYVDNTNDNLGSLDDKFDPLPDLDGPAGRGSHGWPGGSGGGWGGSGSQYPGPNPYPGQRPYPGGGSGGSGGSGGGWGGSGSPYTPDFTPSRYDGSTAAASFGPGTGGGAGGFGPGSGGGIPGGGAGGGGIPGGGIPGGMPGGGVGAGAGGAQSGAARPGGVGAGAGGAGAGRGGGAGAGRAGAMGGMPAGGAGKGQGGEDQEYQRKSWLQENDPEGIFGTDELTPPPVIGDDDYE